MSLTSGARYMLLSTLLFALMNVCVKLLSHLPPLEIILFRSVLSVILSYLMLRALRIRPWAPTTSTLLPEALPAFCR
ncbi:hypothetical protein [Hymenobacter cellulosilyticus]|uniref:hypothetical protein n=1 Tax=Hymenobacter cellulosilyticus TaxID=2932248 RepID=UPI0028801DE8|nr:hypothetical protein [Hymenobacter cellulosilyticus]